MPADRLDPERCLRPRDLEEALGFQEDVGALVRLTPLPVVPALVAGADAAFSGDDAVGAACLFEFPSLEPVETAVARVRGVFPYRPGFLAFREGPAVHAALSSLRRRPGLVLFDGQGIAHPRGAGLASFMGVLMGVPSVGCAKSRLTGDFEPPGPRRGDSAPLRLDGRVVGAVLRTRSGTRPVFVSPGHLVDVDGAREAVLACSRRFRIPEPLRAADHAARAALARDLGR